MAGIERDRAGGVVKRTETDGRYLARGVSEVSGGWPDWLIIVQLCPV